jgi:hypothetical protein
VPKSLAVRAARTFFDTAEADLALYWEAVTHEVFQEKPASQHVL